MSLLTILEELASKTSILNIAAKLTDYCCIMDYRINQVIAEFLSERMKCASPIDPRNVTWRM